MEGVQEGDGRLGVFVNDDKTLEPREAEDDIEDVGKRDGVFVKLVVLVCVLLKVFVLLTEKLGDMEGIRDSELDQEGDDVWAMEPIMAKPHTKALKNICSYCIVFL